MLIAKFKKDHLIIVSLLFFFQLNSCSSVEENPAAEGFNLSASDPKAIEIADVVMKKMGGRKNWDQTRYLTWKFFGRRLHVWDKWTGNIRFEENNIIVLMNVNDKQAQVWKDGIKVSQSDSIQKYSDRGYRAWINDSYWLVMPYKLKDSGVTLKYSGEEKMENGEDALVLTLTFDKVGLTPQNKYDVYVGKQSMLVEQWAFYGDANDKDPRFKTTWANWKRYGKILLSDERGNRKHTDLGAFIELPAKVFNDPESVDILAIGR